MNDTLVLIHGGGLADWFTPMAASPVLSHHRVIRVVRAGYTDAPAPAGLTVSDHSDQTAALLREPAHVVAYSSGCAIGLQLAADHPDLVRTLSLVEPPLVDPLVAPDDRELLHGVFGPVIGSVMEATARGDLETAFDTFMTLVCGPEYRRVLTDTLGEGYVEQAVKRSGYFFTDEIPALNTWTFDPAALSMPVFLIQGSDSPPLVHHLITHLAGLIPGATTATVAGANHLMPLTRTTELAQLIADYCRGR